jgi:hypothetical protein
MHMHMVTSMDMPMKTERVVLLTTPEFKAFLAKEARREGVSVAELVRTRCERAIDPAEAELASLLPALKLSLSEAQTSLRGGLAEAQSVLTKLRAARALGTSSSDIAA